MKPYDRHDGGKVDPEWFERFFAAGTPHAVREANRRVQEANERQALREALAIGAGRCSSPAFGSGR